MALSHLQRITRALIKIIEDPSSPNPEKLDATREYIELTRDKAKPARTRKKRNRGLLGND